MHITRTVTTAVPLPRAFAYLSDFTTTTEWDPGTVATTRLSGDGGPGTRYRKVSRFLGRETELTYTVTELDPGRLVRLRAQNRSVVADDAMSFAGDDRSTTLTYEARLQLRGLARLARPVVAIAFRRLGTRAESGLRRSLEAL
jgi:hypothetical protein